MARKQSVLLTPTELKVKATEAKNNIRDYKRQIAALMLAKKQAEREYTAVVREAAKLRDIAVKEADQTIKMLNRQLSTAEQLLTHLTPGKPDQ
jgi:hypothetical protein